MSPRTQRLVQDEHSTQQPLPGCQECSFFWDWDAEKFASSGLSCEARTFLNRRLRQAELSEGKGGVVRPWSQRLGSWIQLNLKPTSPRALLRLFQELPPLFVYAPELAQVTGGLLD